MSFENKGSMVSTAHITREPDRSGNYVCDGTADNVQIQQALDDFPITGGSIYFSRGKFSIASTIMIDKPVKMVGIGGGTDVANQMTLLELANGTNSDIMRFRGNDNVVTDSYICDIGFLGNKDNNTSGSGLLIQGTGAHVIADIYLDRLLFWECKEYGIEIVNFSHNLWLMNTMLEYCDSGGCLITTATPGSTHLKNVFAIQNTGPGIYANLAHEINLTDCYCRQNSTYGMYLRASTDISIKGGTVRSNGLAGIRLGGCHRAHINAVNVYDNSTASANARDGIETLSEGGYDAEFNRITDCFSGNVATANQRYGVNVQATTLDLVLKNNVFDGNATAPIADVGTRTRMHMKPFQFTEAIVGAAQTSSPTGILVDADTEQALVWGQLPEVLNRLCA